ncbi:hypothetical protein L249_4902 [Ophiocordyceps polyrhachis-furcata BCC 54312]|nr:hypothetical protein L249_4902 [Ophiocordyceps polyrhachis-furcata BCC 54312]
MAPSAAPPDRAPGDTVGVLITDETSLPATITRAIQKSVELAVQKVL